MLIYKKGRKKEERTKISKTLSILKGKEKIPKISTFYTKFGRIKKKVLIL